MCLQLRKKYGKQPFKTKSPFRWKLLRRGFGSLESEFMEKKWQVGRWYKASDKRLGSDKKDVGFHVFTEMTQEIDLICVKMEVRGFVASGHYGYHTTRCETWKEARVVAVFDQQGLDITDKFKPKKKKK